MAVPKTKNDLHFQSTTNFERLIDLVNAIPESNRMKEFPSGTLNRNIRDVLAHLHHWHKMFIDWYTIGMTGKKPEMPAKGYTWKDTKALNTEIQKEYKNIPLDNILGRLQNSHQEVQQIILRHSEQELFEKKRFKWTGTSSLATYLRGATSSHYDWACKLIKRANR